MAGDGAPDAGGVDLYVGGVEHAVLHLLYARFWHKVLFDLGHVSTPEPFQRLVQPGLHPGGRVHRRARRVRRGRRGRGARRLVLPRRRRGRARRRQDGQEPEERGRARRHLPRLRRRHAAALRDVHGPARRAAPVEHRRHRRRAPVPAAAVAQRRRRGHRRAARGPTRRPTTRRAGCCTARSTRSAHDMATLEFNTAIARAVRAEQPADPGRAGAGERAARGGASRWC